MRIKQICSFILIYFVSLGFVSSEEIPKNVTKPVITINSTELQHNATSNTTTTIAPPPQTTIKSRIVPKKEAAEKTTPTIPTTLKPSTTVKQSTSNSTTPKVIPSEGGGIPVNSTQAVKSLNSTSTTQTTSSSTTTTTKSTTTTRITTTPKPSKPRIVYSDEDQPDIVENEKSTEDSAKKTVTNAHDVEEPNVQPSKEQFNPHRDFVVPLVTLIFALPIFLGIAVIGYRKVRDYWSTRHYRRMDFLVDGMYND
ncbi:hypothetical protein ACFFRR_001680 [Megaselia abdita]